MRYIIPIILLLITHTAPALPQSEVHCLAQNIYHEARGEIWQGQLAVALVTINRTHSNKFPNTICKVVYQPGQFSWTTQPHLRVLDYTAWQHALLIASIAIDFASDFTQHFPALYFHNHTVKPRWQYRRLATIGNHTFYH